jgi:hypothetical protein
MVESSLVGSSLVGSSLVGSSLVESSLVGSSMIGSSMFGFLFIHFSSPPQLDLRQATSLRLLNSSFIHYFSF